MIAKTVAEVVLGYAIADALSGLYHFATDRGWNLASQVKSFRAHHERDGADLDGRPTLAGLAVAFVALLDWHPAFFLALGIGIGLAHFTHWLAHYPKYRLVRAFQRFRLILPPEHHRRHHEQRFNRNYCSLSGWNDWWLNWLANSRSGRLVLALTLIAVVASGCAPQGISICNVKDACKIEIKSDTRIELPKLEAPKL